MTAVSGKVFIILGNITKGDLLTNLWGGFQIDDRLNLDLNARSLVTDKDFDNNFESQKSEFLAIFLLVNNWLFSVQSLYGSHTERNLSDILEGYILTKICASFLEVD